MELLPLQEVASQIKPGAALQWGVRDSNGKLLLARGHRVTDAAMLQALLARGVFVDANEMRAVQGGAHAHKPKEGFFGRWRLSSGRLNTLLTALPSQLEGAPSRGESSSPAGGQGAARPCARSELGQALREVADVLLALADRYPDKVLFQILRHDQTRLQSYGVSHSLHCAAVSCLTAKRLGWSDADRKRIVASAMSMNLSMIELQGRLAVQAAPPSAEQRNLIHAHPQRSAELLREAGIDDALWLAAVEQHHERIDGAGYPTGRTDVAEFAQALHYVDVFTAKLSARSCRQPLPPNRAAREIFTGSNGHPLAAALVKEFGIYPPGCFVRLASGEIAIVIHRGETVNTPVVACLTRPNGQPMMRPVRRETTAKDSGIVALVADADVMVRVPWETLYDDD